MEGFVREMVIDLLNDPQFGSSQIHFHSENSELSWKIDQHLMKRALLNFMYNAFIHNDENVEVFVNITEDAITIHDNGKGISLKSRPKFLTAIIVVQILEIYEEPALEWQLLGIL